MAAIDRPENNEPEQGTAIAVLAENPSYRGHLCSILEQGQSIEVLAESSSIETLFTFLQDVDVLVLALAEGEDLFPLLAEREDPKPAVLLITGELRLVRALSLVSSRAWGVVRPNSSPEELRNAVLSLRQGLLVGTPHLLRPLLSRQSAAGNDSSREKLSARELQILRLMAQGLANKEIAWQLKISSNTVKFHSSSIYGKLGAASRAEAVVRGIEQGLITV